MEAVRAAWAPALALSGPIATFPAKRHFFQHSLCSRCSTSSLGVELSWHRECARPATQLPRATKGEGWKSAIYTGMWQASMEEDFLVEVRILHRMHLLLTRFTTWRALRRRVRGFPRRRR